MSDTTPTPPAEPRPPARKRRDQLRDVAIVGLGAVGALFAAVNFDRVKVDWVVGSHRTPLIVVIALSALIGALIDRVVLRRQSKK